MYQPCAPRKRKTNIERKRTGCQNCRKRRRKCDEARPECEACVRRGVKCSGYQRALAFKDVSDQTAELSRKFEAARWAALRDEDERKEKVRTQRKPSRPEQPDASTSSAQDPSSEKDRSERDDSWEPRGPAFTVLDFSRPLGKGKSPAVDLVKPEPRPQTTGPVWSFKTSPPTAPSRQTTLWSSKPSPGRAPIKAEPGRPFDAPLFPCMVFDDAADDWALLPESSVPTTAPSHRSSRSPCDNEADVGHLCLDAMIDSQHVSSLSSPASSSYHIVSRQSPVMNDPLVQGLLVPAADSKLYSHFETTVVDFLPVPFSFRHSYIANECFRLALLAMSSASLKVLSPPTNSSLALHNESRTRGYYMSAVRELYNQLMRPNPPNREALAAAAIMLAYYEIETGTPDASMHHTSGVDAILSKLDMNNAALPEIFKAWRILHFDSQSMMMGYRQAPVQDAAMQACIKLDPSLSIRDIFLGLMQLCDRYTMEVCFPQQHEGGPSPSQQAAAWVAAMLNRKCDTGKKKLASPYTDALTRDKILASCDEYARRLDKWHAELEQPALPILNMRGDERDFIKGDTFDPILPVTFVDFRRATEYIMYVTARLYCNYLRSKLAPDRFEPAMTESWAKLVVGILGGLDSHATLYSSMSPFLMIQAPALLTEGTAVLDAAVSVLSRFKRAAKDPILSVYWQMDLNWYAVVRAEKICGRAVRKHTAGLDVDTERGEWGPRLRFVVFGDNIDGSPLRACHVLDWPRG